MELYFSVDPGVRFTVDARTPRSVRSGRERPSARPSGHRHRRCQLECVRRTSARSADRAHRFPRRRLWYAAHLNLSSRAWCARASVPPISEEYDVSKLSTVTPRRTRVVAASSEERRLSHGPRAPHCLQRRASCLLLFIFFFNPVQHPGSFLYYFPIFLFFRFPFFDEQKRSFFSS